MKGRQVTLIFVIGGMLGLIAWGIWSDQKREAGQKNADPQKAVPMLSKDGHLTAFDMPDDIYLRDMWITQRELEKLDDAELRVEMFNASALKVKDIADPNISTRQALIAEALTKFDAKHGTNNWSRARHHWMESIDAWRQLDAGRNLPFIKRQVEVLTRYYELACRKQGKEPNLEKDIKERFNFFPKEKGPDA